MGWFDLERSDVEGVGGRGSEGEGSTAVGASQARASIRLTPEAAVVWARLDRASRVRLGALFNELVVWYGRTGRLPVAPVSVIMSASELIAKGFEVCREELSKAEKEIARLARELEEAKARLRNQQELENKIREAEQAIVSLRNALSTAEAKLEQYKDKLNHYKNRESRLAQALCPHMEEIKTLLAGNQRAVIELEALCWPKSGSG
jgi:Skp family chaperone for outer membrane proteins